MRRSPGFSLADNAALTGRGRMAMVRFGLIGPGQAPRLRRRDDPRLRRQGDRPRRARGLASPAATCRSTSWAARSCRCPEALVVCQPTWGVDAGAAAAIHQALVDLAARGSALVVISQDLDELLALSDTLAVINQGRLSAEARHRRDLDRGDRPADGRRPRRSVATVECGGLMPMA